MAFDQILKERGHGPCTYVGEVFHTEYSKYKGLEARVGFPCSKNHKVDGTAKVKGSDVNEVREVTRTECLGPSGPL